jgi:hypothetical protein
MKAQELYIDANYHPHDDKNIEKIKIEIKLMKEAGIKVILDIAIRPASIWLNNKYPSINITDENGNLLYPNHRYMEYIGDSYRYEKGIYSTIPFVWDDAKKTLTIGQRKGEFPGIIKERTFNIVVVKENHGNGISIVETPYKSVKYDGTQLKVMLDE